MDFLEFFLLIFKKNIYMPQHLFLEKNLVLLLKFFFVKNFVLDIFEKQTILQKNLSFSKKFFFNCRFYPKKLKQTEEKMFNKKQNNITMGLRYELFRGKKLGVFEILPETKF